MQKLEVILTGKSKAPSVLLPGYVSGSPTSIVVPLVDELEDLLHEYWSSVLSSEEKVLDKIKMHSQWYGVVDGNLLHEAIMQLRDEIPSDRADFKWKVTVLRDN